MSKEYSIIVLVESPIDFPDSSSIELIPESAPANNLISPSFLAITLSLNPPSLSKTTAIVDNANNVIGSNVVSTTITVATPFVPITFTNAGATGLNGPTQSQINTAYASTPLNGLVTANNGIQRWIVPYTGTYNITAVGAGSGASNNRANTIGKGANIIGDINLNKDDILLILVGQRGADNASGNAGGGGGTFVVKVVNNSLYKMYDNTYVEPLIIAGGAGGAEISDGSNARPEQNASTSTSGTQGYMTAWAGGTNGNGATETDSGNAGGGGGGFITNGASKPPFYQYSYDSNSGNGGEGGKSFLNAGVGGRAYYNNAVGGFGGGGGAYGNGGGAGGGGGYSGGGRGDNIGGATAGGGGSYNSGTNQSNTVSNTENGKVIITKVN